MRFIIYGAGGIGCVIGGHLSRQGSDVILVGNTQHVDAINTHGLKLVTGNETFALKIPAVKTANELAPFGENDVVLLCAKSQHTVNCLGQLRNAAAPRSLPVFCAQNSILNESVATRFFDPVYGVMIMIPAIFMTSGEVINPIVRRFGVIEIGRYPQGVDELCQAVAEPLRRAGFFVTVHPEVMRSKGAKCLNNLGNALMPSPMAKAIDAHMQQARRGDAGVERGRHCVEESDSFQRRVRSEYGERKIPAGYRELEKHSSSWQSLARGTGNIEAEQLNGDVVMLGRRLGIAAPYNELLWRIADEMARNGDKPGKYSADELLRMVKQ
jgi:2-dehydropantoate 2-reductase